MYRVDHAGCRRDCRRVRVPVADLLHPRGAGLLGTQATRPRGFTTPPSHGNREDSTVSSRPRAVDFVRARVLERVFPIHPTLTGDVCLETSSSHCSLRFSRPFRVVIWLSPHRVAGRLKTSAPSYLPMTSSSIPTKQRVTSSRRTSWRPSTSIAMNSGSLLHHLPDAAGVPRGGRRLRRTGRRGV